MEYNRWRKYENEQYVTGVENQECGPCERTSSGHRQETRNLKNASDKLQRALEVSESKNAVEQLKMSRNHRRMKKDQSPAIPSSSAVSSSSGKYHANDQSMVRKFAEMLGKFTSDVEKLQSYTEKKRLHRKGMPAALSSLRDVELLSKLLPLISQSRYCSELDVTEAKESVNVLSNQVITCLSLFALSSGYFSVSADVSRVLLASDIYGKEAGFWIIRALSLAGMNNSYLCYLHLKTALMHSPSYPGLQLCVSHFEEDMRLIARRSHSSYTETVGLEIVRAAYFSFYLCDREDWLIDCPDLSVANLSDILLLLGNRMGFLDFYYQYRSTSDADKSKPFFEDISVLNWLAETIPEDRRRQICRQFESDLRSLNCTEVVLIGLFLSHRLWSEGQILFLEGLFASSEQKFAAAMSVLAEVIGMLTADVETELKLRLQSVMASLLINISCCRIHCKSYDVPFIEDRITATNNSIWRLSFCDRLLALNAMNVGELCSLSFEVAQNPVCLWKEVEWLESILRLDDAERKLSFLQELVEMENAETFSKHWKDFDVCIASNGEGSLFSQVHLLGRKCHISQCGEFKWEVSDQLEPVLKSLDYVLSQQSFWTSTSNTPQKVSSISVSIWRQLIKSKQKHLFHLRAKFGLN